MTLVGLHELQAFRLGSKDVSILRINLALSLAIVFLISILVRSRIFRVVEVKFFIQTKINDKILINLIIIDIFTEFLHFL